MDDGTTPVTTGFVYDRMGNLVHDGVYWYRYDAWNRLIQVVEDPGTFAFDSVTGEMTSPGAIPAFADVVAVFAYDALGRLVGRQAPFPGTTDEWRTETYFYDGSRRLAERVRDPIFGNGGGGNSGFQQNQQVVGYSEDTIREYVYTPGYVDEFVAEYDLAGAHWPILQDANHNAVAMVDGVSGDVARQRVFSPYGRVLQDDVIITGSPTTRVGHQGLFAERLDADTKQDPQAAGATVVWHNRQRTLHADYGRFLQRDPHATGVTVKQVLWWHFGDRPIESVSSGQIAPIVMAALLPNQYLYTSSRPVGLADPSGGYPLAPGYYGPGWGTGGVIHYDPNTWRGNPIDRMGASLVSQEARHRRHKSAAVGVLQSAGRVAGAVLGAAMLDGHLASHDAMGTIINDAFLSGSVSALGGTADIVNNVGLFSTGITLGSMLNTGLRDGFGSMAFAGGTMSAVATHYATVNPIAAGAIFGASVYSGILEYAAESAFDW